jgi:hypothetical protein
MTHQSIRIDDIRKATVRGQKVKLFKAWRYSPMAEGYIFDGQYSVPQRTANKNITALYADENVLRNSHAE